ncbi:MAG: hypothetical protein WC527_08995 [Candidatus Margulisiibacteriota bacterium]
MKKFTPVAIFGMLFVSVALPLSRAAENETAGTGVSGTPQEFADLQKTLKSERMDNLEQSVADLKQAVNSLSGRVQDLERTVDDFNGRL